MKTTQTEKRTCIAVGELSPPSEPQTAKQHYTQKIGIFLSDNFKSITADIRSVFPRPHIHKKSYTSPDRRITYVKIAAAAARTMSAGVGTAAAVIAFFTVFSIYFTPCYEFTANGAAVGYSEDIGLYAAALGEVNASLSQNGESAPLIDENVSVSRTIKRRSELTDKTRLKENISALSSLMTKAYVLIADGREVAGFDSEESLNKAIKNFSDSVSPQESEITILNKISCENRYIPTFKMAGENINDVLGSENGIQVQSVKTVTYNEIIPYTVCEENDNTLYQGEKSVKTVGVDGVKTITAAVTAVNAAETDRKIISEQITSEPVNEVILIGTKHKPTGKGSGEFLFPAAGTISSPFGERWNRQHKGMDIANSTGTDIKAADEGVVTFSGTMNGYGNIIILDHNNGYTTYYGHCSKLFAGKGKIVEKGELIAAMGSTGNSTGPHLHFEIRKNNEPVNPEKYVNINN